MGKLFVLMGKSASGKDAVYRNIINNKELRLSRVVSYTTRPLRANESEGVQYFFRTEEDFNRLLSEKKIIEYRTYNTKRGIWRYFTADDGQIDLEKRSYIIIGTIEAFKSLRAYYGEDKVLPVLIAADDGIRLERALRRERRQQQPQYAEMCRRFLADDEDFSKEKIEAARIGRVFKNEGSLEDCLDEVIKYCERAVEG